MATKLTITQVHIFDQSSRYSLPDICEREHICADRILDLVSHSVIEPVDDQLPPSRWQFDTDNFFRLRRALRLQRDLNLNLPGIAVTSDLLDELTELRKQVEQLQLQVRRFMAVETNGD